MRLSRTTTTSPPPRRRPASSLSHSRSPQISLSLARSISLSAFPSSRPRSAARPTVSHLDRLNSFLPRVLSLTEPLCTDWLICRREPTSPPLATTPHHHEQMINDVAAVVTDRSNEQFFTQLRKWVFHERGHLKVSILL
ncbi:hypothetical protein I3843_01G035800 [Carya illinoinensis]|nr:hypothetical protein I3843_01G035800 [Carya illinoinensis]